MTPVYEIVNSVLTQKAHRKPGDLVPQAGSTWHAVNHETGKTYCGFIPSRVGQETTNPRKVNCITCGRRSGAFQQASSYSFGGKL